MKKAAWHVLHLLDRNLEKVFLLAAYSACAGIVAVEVFRRYVLHEQAPWSTTVPAYMFVWITWIGCSYAVRMRLHLAFSEVREHLSRNLQFALMQLDNVLFMVLGGLFVYWSYDLAQLHFGLESIVPGTDDLPSWLFYCATPIGWSALMFRIVQNALEDTRRYLGGKPVFLKGVLSEIKG